MRPFVESFCLIAHPAVTVGVPDTLSRRPKSNGFPGLEAQTVFRLGARPLLLGAFANHKRLSKNSTTLGHAP